MTDNPETTTQLGFCSDHRGLILSVPKRTSEIDAAVSSARRHLAPGETIRVAVASSARGPLQRAIDAVAGGDLPASAGMIDAVVSRSGEIEVRVHSGADPAAVTRLSAALKQRAHGAIVRLSVINEPPVEFALNR